MQSHPLYTCLSLSSLLFLSNAWPLIGGQHARREPASYSVVAVDGGSSGGGTTATVVTDSIVHTETVLKTQLSTVVITESDTPSTILVTITSASPTTVTEHIQTATSPPQTTAEAGQSSAPETVTVIQPLPSTKAYDDGMWHTYYFYTVSEETSLPSSTVDAAEAAPSTTGGLNWWGGLGPESISTTLELSSTVDWPSLWRVPGGDSPAAATSSSSVAAPTGNVPFWGGHPNSPPAIPS